MSSIYGGSRGGGSVYSRIPGPPKKKQQQGGVLGFVENLAGDVRDAAVGLPTGLYKLATDPVESIKLMGDSTWHSWSPLFSGDVDKFWDQFVEHPLAPILDVAAVLTMGAGSAARVVQVGKTGRVSALVRPLPKVSREVAAIEGAPKMFKHYSGNPLTRARQKLMEDVGTGLGQFLPRGLGNRWTEPGRHARLLDKAQSHRQGAVRAAHNVALAAWVKAGRDIMSDPGGIARLVDRESRLGLERHAYRMAESELIGSGKALRPAEGFRFVKAKPHELKEITTVEAFENSLKGFGGRHTTPKASKALRDADGNYLVVHDHTLRKYGEEGARSSQFLRTLYHKPTQVWKYMVLATRPAFFVNNAVGNTAMYLMDFGGMGATRGLIDAWRGAHSQRSLERSLRGADRAIAHVRGTWVDRWHMGTHRGFGAEVKEFAEVSGKALTGRKGKAANAILEGFYEPTRRFEGYVRNAAIRTLMRNEPEVQRLMRRGMKFDEAAEVASRDAALRSRIAESVNDAIGDYTHLSRFETQLRSVIPFYTWNRAILRHGKHIALDRPGRTAVATRVGQEGTETTEEILGDIPKYVKGAVPLSLLGMKAGDDGRVPILTTMGLNPYATIPDVVDFARAVTIGGADVNIGSTFQGQLNPLITGAAEAITGKDLGTGAQIKSGVGGMVSQVLLNTAESLPLVRLFEAAAHEPHPKPNKRTGEVRPFLFSKDLPTQLLAFFGAPIKGMSTQRAAEVARQERGEPKPKRRPQTIYPF